MSVFQVTNKKRGAISHCPCLKRPQVLSCTTTKTVSLISLIVAGLLVDGFPLTDPVSELISHA